MLVLAVLDVFRVLVELLDHHVLELEVDLQVLHFLVHAVAAREHVLLPLLGVVEFLHVCLAVHLLEDRVHLLFELV